jgi:hypothetical protein
MLRAATMTHAGGCVDGPFVALRDTPGVGPNGRDWRWGGHSHRTRERAVNQTRPRNIARFAIVGALALALTAHASELLAADDIQQIKVGTQSLYVPKAWIGFYSVWAGASSGAAINIPQAGTVDVARLTMRPNFRWHDFNFGGFPKFILFVYTPAPPPESENKLSDKYKRMLEDAESLTADGYGFVRIDTGFAKPGEPPPRERFLYKGYRTQYGEALIVDSSNTSGVWSSAGIRARYDMRVQYLFSSPESTWWDLHQHVLAFLDYLQTPK